MGLDHDAYDAYIEKIRCLEYPQLSKTTYLDHAGTTLYARSLIDAYHHDLTNNLYGNPHSYSPASDLSTRKVDQARLDVLNHLQADPDDFDVVFTANATAAVKLVADCFRDQDFHYIYHKDVHISIVGVRELSVFPSRCLATNQEVEVWINAQSSAPPSQLQLFAFPAQSNLNGYRPPYSWCRSIRSACQKSDSAQSTYVLLDAASYLTSGRLDLSCVDDAPDFTALSFYKIFGFPDLGALIVKKTAFDVMTHRRYFGGGTVDSVTVLGGAFHGSKKQSLHDFLEDGTLPFHNILALSYAITVHEKLYGSAQDISQHTASVTTWLYNELETLRHYNDTPVLDIYKDPLAVYGNPSTQGPIIAYNVLRSDGSLVGKSHLERLAIDCGFQLRTGGVCNPGGIASMLHLNHWEMMRNFTEGVRCGGDVDVVGAKPTGICRVSLGPMSTMSDVVRFANFIKFFFVERESGAAVPSRAAASDTGIVKSVAPIYGCSGYSVNIEDFDAHSLWDNQWCIVDPTASEPIQSREILTRLTVTIDVKSEQLRIMHTSGDDISLSLWNIPDSPGNAGEQTQQNAFDLYKDDAVSVWLSIHLGFPCALGRYRHSKLNETKGAITCVLNTCGAYLGCKEKLHDHYSVHAEMFTKAHPLNSIPTPTTSGRWLQKLWKPSTKSSRQDTLTSRSISMTTSLSTSAVDDLNYPKSSSPTDPGTMKTSSTVHKASRLNIGIQELRFREKQVEKKTKSKDHRFAIIVTRVAGKG